MKSFMVSRRAIIRLLTISSRSPSFCRNFSGVTASISHSDRLLSSPEELNRLKYSEISKPILTLNRYFHCTRETRNCESSVAVVPDSDDPEEDEEDEDDTSKEFLSRFVWIMRRKVSEAYPDSDKTTIDAMLLLIVQKVVEEIERGGMGPTGSGPSSPSPDFSEDLWSTVWEVSNTVLKDMEKERKKEKMKRYIQDPDVMEMCRFAGEIGIRGDLLRELRFKWAREKMEDSDFNESLEQLREEAIGGENVETGVREEEDTDTEEKQSRVLSLPKRKGKFRYKIYGLDLSDPKWVEVADKIHEAEKSDWREPKPVTGTCKLVMEKLMSLKEEDDPSALMAEWAELLDPHRVDWNALLDKLRVHNTSLYLKVAELLLDDKSFQAGIQDYSKLINAHSQENHVEDVERILKKMYQAGIFPDSVTITALVHMYSKAGNIDRAKEEFDSLKSLGFRPDLKIYSSMIMAYVNAGKPDLAESLLREMDARDIKRTEELYVAVLRSFTQQGNANAAVRISTSMNVDRIQLSYECCSLLIEAWGKEGNVQNAKSSFEYMRKLGYKPNDRCLANLVQAYKRHNSLDKALSLLLQSEKDGIEIGVCTYTVLVDWMAKLGLNEEVEQLLVKISQLGEAPPFGLQASLCYMYSRANDEKKTLQTLSVLEAKKDELTPDEFETVITGLKLGGFEKDARRMFELMKAQGFTPSEQLKVEMVTPSTLSRVTKTPYARWNN